LSESGSTSCSSYYSDNVCSYSGADSREDSGGWTTAEDSARDIDYSFSQDIGDDISGMTDNSTESVSYCSSESGSTSCSSYYSDDVCSYSGADSREDSGGWTTAEDSARDIDYSSSQDIGDDISGMTDNSTVRIVEVVAGVSAAETTAEITDSGFQMRSNSSTRCMYTTYRCIDIYYKL
jgi:hypothetical protein